ncbi:type II toxin-antitoxin system HipA family toxin [Trinickia dinghuensis]|uniref:Type II toxin-antitoxin system HipA family toxin n=1 Tax=Trinickia dinghuensis TaxID=2291023 RepID=A0A3D8K199_9BURK|nr:type II toxin-antitoxin system HipA family toxin [Trinickia dinghuensis]RDU98615.1 type II toxin-antitoxin system HipA family toxin [Trinickia dinghuensis]
MATRASTNRLNLWMNGLPVGYWEHVRGGETLAYWNEWIADSQGRPLSLSLPFAPSNAPYRGAEVANYFDNLLPDSEAIRRRIATRYKTGGTSPFQMLAKLGRDCVGAIQMLPPDEEPRDLESITGRAMNETDIARLLRDIPVQPYPAQHEPIDDLRLSIAGAQEKTALLLHGGQWLIPQGNTPTTHIFKLPLGLVGNMQADMRTSVENEWLCSKILAAYGLDIAQCEIAHFEDQKALIVERFDRRLSEDGTWIMRLPQEDMCQATGTPVLNKYQADGGPGIETIMGILSDSERAAADRRHFFSAQIIFWLLAATDGHGKNFSIAHRPANRYAATPLYDVLSAHPLIGTGRNKIAAQKVKLAMAVRGKNSHYQIAQIQRRHWVAQGQRVGYRDDQIEAMVDDVTSRTDAAISQAASELPSTFPSDLSDAIFEGMRRLNTRLRNQA